MTEEAARKTIIRKLGRANGEPLEASRYRDGFLFTAPPGKTSHVMYVVLGEGVVSYKPTQMSFWDAYKQFDVMGGKVATGLRN